MTGELTTELYVTGTGQELEVHERTDDCLLYGCCIHAPTVHPLKDCPTHWRSDRGLMERICPHGIGHPDPDALAYRRRKGLDVDGWGVHGCDGCCRRDANGQERSS